MLGPHVVTALLAADFTVTVLTRTAKPGTFASTVKEVEVDYASLDSLTAALAGIDAVVSTTGFAATASQSLLIDAAIAAGVKRFIPSEYGTCTTSPKVENLPLYGPMFEIKKQLAQSAAEGKLSWTVLACGGFLELILSTPGFLNFANHKAELFDGGDNRVSVTSLPKIGRAVAGILQNAEATANKVVFTSQIVLTQNRVLKIVKELRPEWKWDLSSVSTSEILKDALNSIAAGDYSMPVIMKILAGTAFGGDSFGSAYDTTDNQLLGVDDLSEEDLVKLITEKI